MNAPDLPNKHKSKGRAGRTFPVTFVVDQQLEACVDTIKRNGKQPELKIKIPYQARHDDSVTFSAIRFQNESPLTQINGVMRRWQGTSTRVDATITTLNPVPMLHLGEAFILLAVCVFYIATPIVLMLLVPRFTPWLNDFFCVFPITSIPVAILLQTIRKSRIRNKHIQQLRDALTAEPADERKLFHTL